MFAVITSQRCAMKVWDKYNENATEVLQKCYKTATEVLQKCNEI